MENNCEWHSVETPSVFREYKLPLRSVCDTAEQKKQRKELERIAERHGTYIRRTPYQRG